jgi:GntR family transcriptional regulator
MLIDPKSSVPIYLQIAAQVRQQIARGAYRPNESLPSLRSLGAEIGVNPNTVQKAYDELTREGLVESRRGAGLFVVDRTSLGQTSRHEKRVHRELCGVIAQALQDGVSPQRIRTLFRDALDSQVASTRSLT